MEDELSHGGDPQNCSGGRRGVTRVHTNDARHAARIDEDVR
jgi:hypothetical protein